VERTALSLRPGPRGLTLHLLLIERWFQFLSHIHPPISVKFDSKNIAWLWDESAM
jgi:hypothetical protein